MGKITKSVVAEQMLEYMDNNGLMSKDQHGAMKNHSPITATTTIYEELLKATEDKDLASSLLIDLTAAYDLIDQGILDTKLEAYGFSLSKRKWIKSYLENSTQDVDIKGKQSTTQFLGKYGTPQGSISGGILFLIFGNDLPEDNSVEKISTLFVDDTNEIVKADNMINLKHKLQFEANKSIE